MSKQLSATQRTALLKAAADYRGRVVASRPTWKALELRGYIVKGSDGWYDYTITPAGIEAIGFTVEAVLLKQARAKLAIMEESEGRVRRNFSGYYRHNDVEEAERRVLDARFELAALECAIG